jgi:hypothetical protein
MERYEKILVLDNAFEAERMKEILTVKEIPFAIIPSSDSSFGGINRLEFGWGYLEAEVSRKEEINSIYRELTGKDV